MAPRVLISDKLSETAVQIFNDRGLDVTFEPDLGKDKDRLLEMIPDFDGLAIRSATKVTEKLLAAAKNLKVIGRAGIGVDNVDMQGGKRARRHRHEHAVRQLHHHRRTRHLDDAGAGPPDPRRQRLHPGRQMGEVEVHGRRALRQDPRRHRLRQHRLIVADRGLGLKMKVIAFDPFLSPERAIEIGVEKVELDDLLTRADFITLHTPLTDKTRNILDAASPRQDASKGVRIINCARGGLVDEAALADAHHSRAMSPAPRSMCS